MVDVQGVFFAAINKAFCNAASNTKDQVERICSKARDLRGLRDAARVKAAKVGTWAPERSNRHKTAFGRLGKMI